MDTAFRRRTTAAAIGIAAAAVVALGGSTYPAFTGSAPRPGGAISGGTLQLDLKTKESSTAFVLDDSGIYPGKVLAARALTVRNAGSLDGSLDIALTIDAHGGRLQDQLTVSVSCTGDDLLGSLPAGTIMPLSTGFLTSAVPLDAGEQVICTFRFALPDRPDNNVVQGDRLTVDSVFTLTQPTSG